jgi:hypothetical protein
MLTGWFAIRLTVAARIGNIGSCQRRVNGDRVRSEVLRVQEKLESQVAGAPGCDAQKA